MSYEQVVPSAKLITKNVMLFLTIEMWLGIETIKKISSESIFNFTGCFNVLRGYLRQLCPGMNQEIVAYPIGIIVCSFPSFFTPFNNLFHSLYWTCHTLDHIVVSLSSQNFSPKSDLFGLMRLAYLFQRILNKKYFLFR